MNFLIVASGFTQERYDPASNGCARLYRSLRRAHVSETTEVWFREWHEQPRNFARYVAKYSGKRDRVMIAAYSYGCGWWFRRFAERLVREGQRVDTAVLCDPVYRRDPAMRWMQWRAVLGGPQTLRLPPNIERVVHFLQRENQPGGDRLEVGGSAEIEGPHDLGVPHEHCDNADAWHEAAEREAAALFG